MTQDIFKTKDTALAAYLFLHCEFRQCFLSQRDRKSVYFTYTKTEELQEHIQKFFSGDAVVEPNEYYTAIHTCRKLLAQTLRPVQVDAVMV